MSKLVIPGVIAQSGNGGGGGGTVDQTYDPTSTNAQSGTAVAEAVAPAIQNESTQNGALCIGGYGTTVSTHKGNENSIVIGKGAYTDASNYLPSVIIGSNTGGKNASVTIGTNAGSNSYDNSYNVVIGTNSNGADKCIAIGAYSYAKGPYSGEIAIGSGTSATSNGAVAQANNAIQLGVGTNSTASSFQVFNYQMLDANGHIPNERIYYPQPQYKAYTITGSDVTVDNNNVATGFKCYGDNNINNSYLLVNEKIPTITTTLEVIIEFNVASIIDDAPLFMKNDTTVRSIYLKQVSGQSYYQLHRWDGTANADGATQIQPNITYQLKYIFNKANSSTESCYLLVNNEWVEQWSPAANAGDLFGGQAVGIGGSYRYGGGYIDGNIYLDNTAIYANGNLVFSGTKNFIPATQGITGIQGYNVTKTQVLKNVNGTLTWVDE